MGVSRAQLARANMGLTNSPAAQAGPGMPWNGGEKRAISDQRFRSFAERYLIARAAFFRQDPNGLLDDTWSCLLDAKRAYAMIRRTGENIPPEDSNI